jgi:hypothetical protein
MKCTRGFTSLILILILAVLLIGGVYIYLRKESGGVKTLSLTSLVTSNEGGYEIRTHVLGLSTTSLPFITSYKDTQIMKSINLQTQNLANDSSCGTLEDMKSALGDAGYSEKKIAAMNPTQMMEILNWNSDIEAYNVYFAHGILSFPYTYDDYCGGAHPDAGVAGVTYDLQTGKEVGFTDLFANYTRDQTAIKKILDNKYLLEDHKEQADSGQPYDSQCSDATLSESDSAWDYASYYISKERLTVIPSFSHAEAPCALEVPVPIQELTPYLSATSTLLRI